VSIDGDSSIPIQSIECPCQRSRDSSDMDESWMSRMSEVQSAEVEEVDDQDDLSDEEMSSDEEHDEGELEKVVEDEVASNTSCSLYFLHVLREEVPQVNNLEEEEGQPVKRGHQGIEREGSRETRVLSPDGVSPFQLVILWHAIGVIDGEDDIQKPGEDSQDLVGPDSLIIVGVAICEWVCV